MAAEVTLGGVNFGLIFSHNLFFFHGLMITVALRALMDRLGLGHYIDDETQKRITGSAVDLMVVATLMSIEFAMLATYFVPIVLVCVAVAAITALLCFGLGRRLASLGIERALTVFGCCCGSTGSGLLLLRMLDPTLTTPIAKELAFFNIAILVLSFHVLMLMAPILPTYEIGTIVLVYGATFIVGAFAALWLGRRVLTAA
jgi:ESS family glutamate:Na+ symporter